MIFDTHAHYDDDRFQEDRFELLAAMPERGVGAIVNPGCTLESSRMAIELAERYPFVHAAVGFHPENCHDYCPEQLAELKQKVVDVDPDAFVILQEAHQVLGDGFIRYSRHSL